MIRPQPRRVRRRARRRRKCKYFSRRRVRREKYFSRSGLCERSECGERSASPLDRKRAFDRLFFTPVQIQHQKAHQQRGAQLRVLEIAAAIIELKPGVECTQKEIEDFCLELPRYKRPREIIFDKVPRNPTGKIEKPKLREKYNGKSIVAQQVGIET